MGEIQNDHKAIAFEEEGYRPLPIVQKVSEEDVRENYLKIKSDVQRITQMELKKIKNNQPRKIKKRKNRESVSGTGNDKISQQQKGLPV